MFKYISEAYPDEFSADYEYYKDKTDYYYDRKVSYLKKMVARRVIKSFEKDIVANRM
jgi:hypothetical protein